MWHIQERKWKKAGWKKLQWKNERWVENKETSVSSRQSSIHYLSFHCFSFNTLPLFFQSLSICHSPQPHFLPLNFHILLPQSHIHSHAPPERIQQSTYMSASRKLVSTFSISAILPSAPFDHCIALQQQLTSAAKQQTAAAPSKFGYIILFSLYNRTNITQKHIYSYKYTHSYRKLFPSYVHHYLSFPFYFSQ